MVIAKPLPFVTAFVDTIDKAIQAHAVGQRLSPIQRTWLAFCLLTAILVTQFRFCWSASSEPAWAPLFFGGPLMDVSACQDSPGSCSF